jgi:spore coat protein A
MVSRRKLLKAGSAGLLSSLISPWSFAQTAPALLQGTRQRQFTRLMPNPLDPANLFAPDSFLGTAYTLRIREFQAALGLTDPATGAALTTTLWGYGSNRQAPSYPGRTFNVRRGIPITVRYVNRLMNSAGPLPHRLPVDTTLDWANPGNLGGRAPVPLVAHRHGGDQVTASDGLPEAWSSPDVNKDGMPDYRGRLYSATYTFDNRQEAAHLWYHDHALGVTRLNVHGAGGQLLHPRPQRRLPGRLRPAAGLPLRAADLHPGPPVQRHRRPQLPGHRPGQPQAPNPTHLPEFFGDVIVANGVPWPLFNCERRMYRLRLLNGSDSRVYTLSFNLEKAPATRLTFWQIGTDLGLMNSPVALTSLVLAPGERADVLVDFSTVVNSKHGKVIMMNSANTPFPNGLPPVAGTTDRVMAFSVTKPSASSASACPSSPATGCPPTCARCMAACRRPSSPTPRCAS